MGEGFYTLLPFTLQWYQIPNIGPVDSAEIMRGTRLPQHEGAPARGTTLEGTLQRASAGGDHMVHARDIHML